MKKMRVLVMLTLVEQVVWTLRVTSQIPDIGTMAMIKMMLKVLVMASSVTVIQSIRMSLCWWVDHT